MHSRLVVSTLSIALALVACGGGEARSDGVPSLSTTYADHPSTITVDREIRQIAQDRTVSLSNEIDQVDPEVGLFAAQAVLLGKVASVDGPFWNQLNGQKWAYDGGTGPRESGDYTTPMMYYQVGIEPQQALADEIGLRSPVVEFLVPAFEMDGGESPVPVGLFEVGDRVVTALSVDIFYFRSEPVLALRLFGGTAFHVDQSDMVRPWALVANERARAENPDVPAIDVKPTALASFLDSVESLRSAEKPEWEAYRSVQSETEERLRGILEYLESGDLPAGYDEGPTSTIGGN